MFKVECSDSGIRDIIVHGPRTEIPLAEKASVNQFYKTNFVADRIYQVRFHALMCLQMQDYLLQ